MLLKITPSYQTTTILSTWNSLVILTQTINKLNWNDPSIEKHIVCHNKPQAM